jgi:hypothetical protein
MNYTSHESNVHEVVKAIVTLTFDQMIPKSIVVLNLHTQYKDCVTKRCLVIDLTRFL